MGMTYDPDRRRRPVRYTDLESFEAKVLRNFPGAEIDKSGKEIVIRTGLTVHLVELVVPIDEKY